MKKQISNTWELKKKNLGMVEILLNKIKVKKKKTNLKSYKEVKDGTT